MEKQGESRKAQEQKGEDRLMTLLSLFGIGFIIFAWVFAFKWGVPLVKALKHIQ